MIDVGWQPKRNVHIHCAHTFFTSLSGCGLVQMDEKGIGHWMVVI
jgi:hypothetical protein